MMPPVRVICVGSPFGDDGLGRWAAERLVRELDATQAQVSWHDRPGVSLLQALEGARKAVLVDAVQSGAAPGTLHRLEGEAIYGQLARHTSTHGFGLADALALAVRLGYAPTHLVLCGVEMDNHDLDQTLSPRVAAALPGLIAAVRAEVAADMNENAGATE